MSKLKYDSSVARMAGNIASGLVEKLDIYSEASEYLAPFAVALARAIVAEVQRTEPVSEPSSDSYCGAKGYTASGVAAFCSLSYGHDEKCNLAFARRP